MPIMVARRDRRIVGYVVSSSLARSIRRSDPRRDAASLSGRAGSYVYGPICVAESERGKGVARAMVEALKARLPGREGFTFIRADNAVSRKVHAGMGMREAATFAVDGVDYVVVAYVG